jgi:integrase
VWKQGRSPKNGPRRYLLDRRLDEIGWITDACDALDRWIALRRPERGDFLFSSYESRDRAWTNQDLNRRLHEIGQRAGVAVGRGTPGNRTFQSFRHACASKLLERGVTHPHVAWWIGNTQEEFIRTYGRPTLDAMTRVTLGRSPSTPIRRPLPSRRAPAGVRPTDHRPP